ncbi:MAG: methyltransferase domain-containing protein [Saccharospirillaceae bacterium]|nr:class I SAM-dependent methyltransferase [Pseudomonadales bacterium]NRB77886.1 methyltransferase domain-containing protein [Saccharospirillaceae bacterium]
MHSQISNFLPPLHLLACPNCYAGVDEGLEPHNHLCKHCDSQFFNLDGIACWFDSAMDQKTVWEHHLAVTKQMAEQNSQMMSQALQSPFTLKSTQARVQQMHQASNQSAGAVLDLLINAGLTPKMHDMLPPQDSGLFGSYFELMHRDWAWHSFKNDDFEDENLQQFELLKSIAQKSIKDSQNIGHVLVLGGGAGRLAYEFHQHFNPKSTTVLDINPLLIQSAHQVVNRKQSIRLDEVRKYPQINVDPSFERTLKLPKNHKECENLFFMVADAYNTPFKQQQFDVIITPWFVDVVGVDMKKTMGVVHSLLKPGSTWLNFGPLLYLDKLEYAHKYHQTEVEQLLQNLNFNMIQQDSKVMPYSLSPDDKRQQHEQIWCFGATSPKQSFSELSQQTFSNAAGINLPLWSLFTHLPIPKFKIDEQTHPVLKAIVEQIDGQTSADEVALMLEGKLPEHLNPSEVVCTLILENILK